MQVDADAACNVVRECGCSDDHCMRKTAHHLESHSIFKQHTILTVPSHEEDTNLSFCRFDQSTE